MEAQKAMSFTRISFEEKVVHLLAWAAEWHENGQGRSMWAYSLSIGGSHALLNGWMKSERLINMLTQEEKGLIETARSMCREGTVCGAGRRVRLVAQPADATFGVSRNHAETPTSTRVDNTD
ncbi:hypothetical protein AB0A81_23830 [Streptomyces flaveolus]|uniref:Uncharacterized protein n=1 Tax=Streptomyces flaveolus TaxID=67297 RepID=A0ABV1VMG3_9ACTN